LFTTVASAARPVLAARVRLVGCGRSWLVGNRAPECRLRPGNHRKEARIRAHVLLCWLALLLIRIAENQIPTLTWRRIREELQTLHVGQFTGNAGQVHQRTELTPDQRDILRALQVPEAPRFLQLTTAN